MALPPRTLPLLLSAKVQTTRNSLSRIMVRDTLTSELILHLELAQLLMRYEKLLGFSNSTKPTLAEELVIESLSKPTSE